MIVIPKKNLKRVFKKTLTEPEYAWRAARQRIKSYFSYKALNGLSAYPETVSLFLTHRCNLRCKMCGQWGENGSSKNMSRTRLTEELSLEIMRNLVDELSKFKPNITLFGGEPFLYKDWQKLVKYIKHKKMRVNIITNGTLLTKFAEQIVDSGLDELIISLDGPAEIHDRIKNRKGSFQEILTGVELLNQKRSDKSPIINFTSVITEDNFQYLAEIKKVAEQLQAKSITFHHLIFISKNTYNSFRKFFQHAFGKGCYDWAGFVHSDLPKIDPYQLNEFISNVSKSSNGLDVSFYPNLTAAEIIKYYTHWEFRSESYPYRCLSPWMVAYIFPDGSVRPFHTTDFVAGNIKINSFKEIWNGEQYKLFRKTVKEKKAFPVCTRCTEFYRY